jgi:hypothetical protein
VIGIDHSQPTVLGGEGGKQEPITVTQLWQAISIPRTEYFGRDAAPSGISSSLH